MREQDNLKRSEYERMQKELFEKARRNLFYSQEDHCNADTAYGTAQDDNILRVFLGDDVEERCIDQGLMAEAVDYVIRVPLEELRYFL